MPPRGYVKPFEEKFWPKVEVDPNSGCWLWTGALFPGGYAALGGKGTTTNAHRLAYEHFVGPVPSDMDVDHKCRVRCCVNPAHMVVATRKENIRRAIEAGAHVGAATHCPRGHAYEGENVHWVEGRRYCQTCRETYYRRNERRAGARYACH